MRSWRAIAGRLVTATLLALLAWAPATAAPAASSYGAGVPIAFPLFPADNPWNTDISDYPVDPLSDRYVAASVHRPRSTRISGPRGTALRTGSPMSSCPATSRRCPSPSTTGKRATPDRIPSPRTPPSRTEATVTCSYSTPTTAGSTRSTTPTKVGDRWEAGSGAVFDLTSNALRPDTWTSADAAGLPMLPGLVRYDEVAAGRSTTRCASPSRTQRAFIHPATHFASDSTDPTCPRWVCDSDSRPGSTSPASPSRYASSFRRSRRTACSWPTTGVLGTSRAPRTRGGTTTCSMPSRS